MNVWVFFNFYQFHFFLFVFTILILTYFVRFIPRYFIFFMPLYMMYLIIKNHFFPLPSALKKCHFVVWLEKSMIIHIFILLKVLSFFLCF